MPGTVISLSKSNLAQGLESEKTIFTAKKKKMTNLGEDSVGIHIPKEVGVRDLDAEASLTVNPSILPSENALNSEKVLARWDRGDSPLTVTDRCEPPAENGGDS